jgi:uncharacterized membrane protein (UPF0127 family)
MQWTCLAVAAMALVAYGCHNSSPEEMMRDFSAQEVTLPNGAVIKVEVMSRPVDMARGMMFRDSLAPDRGMLFIHGGMGKQSYWMYNVRIPLDIIWMDADRRVVEISANTPPCLAKSAKTCPSYGGHENAMYVLELSGGAAAKNGVQVGSVLQF